MSQNRKILHFLAAFIAGFISTLTFHQGALAVLHAINFIPVPPYATEPTPPFGVPQFLSLAFWGGVWGIILAALPFRSRYSLSYWGIIFVFSALAPTFVFLFVILPLKGLPVAGGWQPNLIVTGLILNDAWGIGTAIFLRLLPREA